MIRALIFDCFGVLVRDGWLPYKERHFGEDHTLWQEATDLNRMVDAGLLTYEDFLKGVAELAHIDMNQARREIENNPANEQLFEWIRDDLKPQYKIGLLSNAARDWLGDLFEPWQVELLDETVLSYQMGALKPEPVMYRTIAERLGVDMSECLFIDDQQRYCDGATALGMPSVHYIDNKSLQIELQKYNISVKYF